jgi:hypothetical protein
MKIISQCRKDILANYPKDEDQPAASKRVMEALQKLRPGGGAK